MASVDGLTKQKMLEIADASVVSGAVDASHNLILETRGGDSFNAGYVKGTPGAPGGTDVAFGDWIRTSGSNTQGGLGDLFTRRKRLVGLKPDCVIIGSSNAITGTWGAAFCADWGLTERNFAIGGTAYTGTNNFGVQLNNAIASGTFANNNVAVVIIADASNNIRNFNDAGTTVDITTNASDLFAAAKTNFPNARVICLPVVWPADPRSQVTGVPGGYQNIWHEALIRVTEQLRVAARNNNVEIVDDAHTWLTGLTGVMEASGGVHPNATGYQLISRWMSQYIQGCKTRADTGWTTIPYNNAGLLAPVRLRARREGWTVFIEGGVKITAATSGTTDFATLPIGFRPNFETTMLPIRANGSSAATMAQIYTNGTIRLWGSQSAGAEFYVSGSYVIG